MTHQTRLRDHINRLRSLRGVAVTYGRQGVTASITATVGKTTAEQDIGQDSGTIIRVPVRDYIFASADLTSSVIATLPLNGDTITEADGTVHEVRPLGSEPCWRWHDSGRTQIRIHTKQVTNL